MAGNHDEQHCPFGRLCGPLVTEAMLAEITASGGTMVMAIGCNMFKITQICVGNCCLRQ